MDKKEWQREYHRRIQEDAKPAYDALMSCYPFTLEDLPDEQWKPIEGYDCYEVSTFGRVKSFKGIKPRILKPQLSRGYLRVNLQIGDKSKRRMIHVLVATAFIPNPDLKPEVNHDDGRKFNCHVSNLYWVTTAENNQHAVKNGLKFSAKGVDDSNSKIKDEADIIYIRENPDNLSTYELAEMFGMSAGQIGLIQRGKTYENAGGTVRAKIDTRIPDEIREQIRADWATGLYTKTELAKRYGCSRTTISNIIREG